ncbi:hypothetical protein V8E54_008972 [Elaphomyces granulatus]
MSDTCIVCLGDLGGGVTPSPVAAASPRPHRHGEDSPPDLEILGGDENAGQIAHLLPCGHNLHHNCLKPWVERANSCPICRQNFNMVELSDSPGGPVLSAYAVQDKVQVADIDPSMIIEEIDEDSESQPCPICGDNDNEEVLLLCDGCDVPSHTYCIGLDEVPSGYWYCDQCDAQRAIGSVSHSPTRQSHSRPGRRTRAQQRRLQNRNQANSLHWAQVWQSVWDRLNLDLDFPFDDDLAADRFLQQRRREAAHQREFQAWQRRAQVAERQGGGQRFIDPTSILDNYAPRPSRPRVPRAPTPQPESLEEMRAWNAFERARELESDPSASRKRKSPTLSPSPEPTEPERKLKRPRTRRAEELAALAVQTGEASRAARPNADNNPAVPSFLQSLLKEVEDASFSNRKSSIGPSALSSNTPTDHNTPGTLSPSLSPAPSNYSSPRLSSVSPPPHLRGRPTSPVQLVSPADSSPPSSPDFSPSASPVTPVQDRGVLVDSRPIRPDSRIRGARSLDRPRGRPLARSNENSPTRAGLSLSVKSDVQKLVGDALRPFYRRKVVSKDEYTDINRTISRMLYELIGEAQALDADRKTQLQAVAGEEVNKAVEALQRSKDKSSSDDQRP